jgi:hypothetical protein
MSNTARLGLPLLQAAQAQKHVTVNDALVRLDGAAQMVLASVDLNTPPGLANDGDCYGVAAGGVNEWAGHAGEVAIRTNGGWVFLAPQRGWRARITDRQTEAVHDGTGWVSGALALSAHDAATVHEIVEIDHVLSAGPTDTVAAALPVGAVVLGVTGRVTATISGTLAGWRIGVAGSDNRYGSGLGLAQGAWLRGLTASPLSYYTNTDLLLTGEGGDFAGGAIRLAVHLWRLNLPS